MHPKKRLIAGTLIALASGTMMTASRAHAQTGGAQVLRTLVYHEITALPTSPNASGAQAPLLSASGNRAVFAMAPGTGDPAKPNRIFVIEADGSGMREVDAYRTLCYCGSMVDISADGSTVISSDYVQLRIASANGGGGRTLVTLASNELNALSLSGDGTKAFFRLYRDTAGTVGASTTQIPMERGIWVINADGSGLRQIVGPRQIAAALGSPVNEISLGGNTDNGLDVSADGSRILFGWLVRPESGGVGQGLFATNLAGTDVRDLLGRRWFIKQVGISSDGSTVGYSITNPAAPYDEAGVIRFDGTGQRKLTDSTQFASTGSGDRVQLSADGSRLLLGSTSGLFDTATGALVQLGVRSNFFSSDPAPLVTEGLAVATMNDAATRFLYLAPDDRNVNQLATLDLNPASAGNAPTITNASVDPGFVLLGGRSLATVAARVSAPASLTRVSAAVLRDGRTDRNVSGPVLLDDGRNGDVAANDSLFTHNSLYSDCCAVLGPRTVRIKAEAREASGRRHATAVDIGPFEIKE